MKKITKAIRYGILVLVLCFLVMPGMAMRPPVKMRQTTNEQQGHLEENQTSTNSPIGDAKDSLLNIDLNCDGVLDHRDIYIISAYYEIAYSPLVNSPDFNKDGIVNLFDLGSFLAMYGFGCYGLRRCPANFIGDCIVDKRDLDIIISFYGQSYTGVISPDFNKDGIVDIVDLGIFLGEYGRNNNNNCNCSG